VGLWERLSLLLLMTVYCFWLLTMPLSPYPSHLSVGLGDPPGYFLAAANLIAGKGWSPDYFVGDYVGGYLTYVKTQPLLVLVTTFFFQIFDVNWLSLYIYDATAGVLLIFLMVAMICLSVDGTARDSSAMLLLTMLAVVIPTHFLLIGLGAVTIPGALAFLAFAAFATTNVRPVVAKRIAIGVCAFFLLFVRPEALLLLIIAAAVYFVRGIVKTWQISKPFRFLSIAGLLLLLVLAWTRIPDIINSVPQTSKGMAVSYLRYDSSTGRFAPLFYPWWELNHNLSRANFQNPGMDFNIANSDIGIELRKHPVQFLMYLVNQLPNRFVAFAQSVGFPELPAGAAFIIWAVLLSLMLIEPCSRPLAAAVFAFLLLCSALNPYLTVRHLLLISPAVIALSLRPVLARWLLPLSKFGFLKGYSGRCLFAAAITAGLILVSWNGSRLVMVRTDPANRSYKNIFEDLKRVTSITDVVASSYPQLITCVTGRPSVGATWLIENIHQIIRTYSPDFILVDNAKGDLPNYTILLHDHAGKIKGYESIIHNRDEKYIIFRSMEYGRHALRSNVPNGLSRERF
jgi:hypothetical protein